MCLVIRDLYLHRAVHMPYSRQCSSFNNFWITSFVIKHILEYVSGNYGYWAGLIWGECVVEQTVLWVNFWGKFSLLTSLRLCIICSAYDFFKKIASQKRASQEEKDMHNPVCQSKLGTSSSMAFSNHLLLFLESIGGTQMITQMITAVIGHCTSRSSQISCSVSAAFFK